MFLEQYFSEVASPLTELLKKTHGYALMYPAEFDDSWKSQEDSCDATGTLGLPLKDHK